MKPIIYMLCASLLLLSQPNYGAGKKPQKKVVPKKTAQQPKKKAAAAVQAKKPVKKTTTPPTRTGAGAGAGAGAYVPPVPPVPVNLFAQFLSTVAAGDIRSVRQSVQNNPEFALLADEETGDTALIVASRAGKKEEIIEFLLNAGADVNHKNKKGQDAIDVAATPTIRGTLLSATGIMPPPEPVGAGAPPAARPEKKREVAQNPPPIPAWYEEGAAAGAGAGAPPPIPVWEEPRGAGAAQTHKAKPTSRQKPTEEELQAFLLAIRRQDKIDVIKRMIMDNPLLLSSKEDPDIETYGTGLIAAAESSNEEAVRLLLEQTRLYFPEKFDEIITMKNRWGQTAQHVAQEKALYSNRFGEKNIERMLTYPKNPERWTEPEESAFAAGAAAGAGAGAPPAAQPVKIPKGATPPPLPPREEKGVAAGAGAGAGASTEEEPLKASNKDKKYAFDELQKIKVRLDKQLEDIKFYKKTLITHKENLEWNFPYLKTDLPDLPQILQTKYDPIKKLLNEYQSYIDAIEKLEDKAENKAAYVLDSMNALEVITIKKDLTAFLATSDQNLILAEKYNEEARELYDKADSLFQNISLSISEIQSSMKEQIKHNLTNQKNLLESIKSSCEAYKRRLNEETKTEMSLQEKINALPEGEKKTNSQWLLDQITNNYKVRALTKNRIVLTIVETELKRINNSDPNNLEVQYQLFVDLDKMIKGSQLIKDDDERTASYDLYFKKLDELKNALK